jgi:hypothetical protein
MIDTITHKPIEVSTDDGGKGPYLIVPFEQLAEITALLDANEVSYWVDEEVLSIDDEPERSRSSISVGALIRQWSNGCWTAFRDETRGVRHGTGRRRPRPCEQDPCGLGLKP